MQSLKEIIQHVRENSPNPEKCLVAFSGGKDAWGVAFTLRDHFEIIPYYYYMVPGLEVVEEYLAYCEAKLGTHIVRLPSPVLHMMFEGMVFQAPERYPVLYAANLPQFDWDDVSRLAELSAGLPENSWTAIGVRAADSIQRASAIKKHGAWNDSRRVFYPIWDWRKDDIVKALKDNGVRLSPEYQAFGRTFDGLYLLYAWNLKKHFPRDYARCLEFFPMMDLEVFRLERALEKYGSMDALPKADALAAMDAPKPEAPKRFSFTRPSQKMTIPKPMAPEESRYSKLNAQAKQMANKDASMTDAGFWVSVYFSDKSRFEIVFEDRGQKDHFLAALKLTAHGDMFLDGGFVAQKMGLDVPGVSYSRLGKRPEKVANPLDGLEATGNPETECLADYEALLKAFPKPVPLAGSLAEKFLAKAKWGALHKNGRLWCHDLAPLLGIELPPTTYFYRPEARPDAKLNALVG
jgi:hypothetical protein